MLALEKAHGTKPVPWLPARDRNRGGLMRYALALPTVNPQAHHHTGARS